jgi:hypothetical protein
VVNVAILAMLFIIRRTQIRNARAREQQLDHVLNLARPVRSKSNSTAMRCHFIHLPA